MKLDNMPVLLADLTALHSLTGALDKEKRFKIESGCHPG